MMYLLFRRSDRSSYFIDAELGVLACERSDEGLAVVDRLGSLRLLETGPMQLQRSLDEWMAMVGQGLYTPSARPPQSTRKDRIVYIVVPS